jgi:hypothetical protein
MQLMQGNRMNRCVTIGGLLTQRGMFCIRHPSEGAQAS